MYVSVLSVDSTPSTDTANSDNKGFYVHTCCTLCSRCFDFYVHIKLKVTAYLYNLSPQNECPTLGKVFNADRRKT